MGVGNGGLLCGELDPIVRSTEYAVEHRTLEEFWLSNGSRNT